MKHLAPTIRAALASLEAGLQARIDVFNAEPENEVALELPKAFVFGGDDVLATFPAIEVAIPQSGITDFSVGQEDFDVTNQVIVCAWVERFAAGSDQVSRLYELALGLGRCVLEVLLVPDAFGADVVVNRDQGVTSTYGANPELRDFQTFRMGAVHRFTLDDEDRRP